MGGAADVVAEYLKTRYTEGASLDDALHLAVAALGHTDASDRVIPVEDLEVAVLDRTRTQPRKFRRLAPARLTTLLADRGPSEPAPEEAGRARTEPGVAEGGSVPSPGTPDDPKDPTDQVSGGVEPLEDPVSGEPPAEPPTGPPPVAP